MSNYKASASRTIHFTSKGGGYSAIWMSDRGDLYQEYLQSGGNVTYYPAITPSDAITMHLTVVSARTQGAITPASVAYRANGTDLEFNTSGVCTTAGFGSIFKRDGDGNLVIIGNLGAVNLGSFLIEATISITGTSGGDTMHVSAPVTLVPYSGTDSARVTIAPGDSKNFTIDVKGGSCVLKALTYKGGQEISSGLSYQWYRFSNNAFAVITGATAQTLTVAEADVDTYGLYKVIVKEGATELGFDTQGVLDASDPFDIIIGVTYTPSASGSPVATNDLTLNDEMDDAASLTFTCQFVKRGQTASVSGTQSFVFTVVSGNGLQLWHPTTMTGGNVCKVTVADLKQYGGVGDYEIIADGTLAY